MIIRYHTYDKRSNLELLGYRLIELQDMTDATENRDYSQEH